MIRFLKINTDCITNNIPYTYAGEKKSPTNRHTKVMKMSWKGYKRIVKRGKMQIQTLLLPATPGSKMLVSGVQWSKPALFQTLHRTLKRAGYGKSGGWNWT